MMWYNNFDADAASEQAGKRIHAQIQTTNVVIVDGRTVRAFHYILFIICQNCIFSMPARARACVFAGRPTLCIDFKIHSSRSIIVNFPLDGVVAVVVLLLLLSLPLPSIAAHISYFTCFAVSPRLPHGH